MSMCVYEEVLSGVLMKGLLLFCEESLEGMCVCTSIYTYMCIGIVSGPVLRVTRLYAEGVWIMAHVFAKPCKKVAFTSMAWRPQGSEILWPSHGSAGPAEQHT